MDREYGPRRKLDRFTTRFLGFFSLYSPGKTWLDRVLVGYCEYASLESYNRNMCMFLSLQEIYSKGRTWRYRTNPNFILYKRVVVSKKLYKQTQVHVTSHYANSEWRRRAAVGPNWFKHITNNVATNHWAKTTKPLLPSDHLNCSISDDQTALLIPSMQDVILSILKDKSVGKDAKKKRATG